MTDVTPRKLRKAVQDPIPDNSDRIHRILEVSLGHITQETSKWLEVQDRGKVIPLLIVYAKDHYGWIILIPEDLETIEEEVPSDLADLLEYSVEQDVRWLMLDKDADELKGFPLFDW